MATVDYAGDTLVVGDIVTGVSTPGSVQIGNPNIVGMDIGAVIFAQYNANNATAISPTTATTLSAFFAGISSNGAMTVAANQTYMFEGQYTIAQATNTSHTWAVGFGGNATVANIGYQLYSTVNATTGLVNANSQSVYVSTTGASAVTGTCTASSESTLLFLNGIVRFNGGGTFIPQIKSSIASTASSPVTISAGSYFGMWPVGNSTTQTVGSWS